MLWLTIKVSRYTWKKIKFQKFLHRNCSKMKFLQFNNTSTKHKIFGIFSRVASLFWLFRRLSLRRKAFVKQLIKISFRDRNRGTLFTFPCLQVKLIFYKELPLTREKARNMWYPDRIFFVVVNVGLGCFAGTIESVFCSRIGTMTTTINDNESFLLNTCYYPINTGIK